MSKSRKSHVARRTSHAARSLPHIYFAPPENFHGSELVLPPDEARHAGKVMRQQIGDEVVVVDGEGGWYRVRLDVVDARHASGTVLETRQEVGEPSVACTIGLALLKNRNRFEVFLEKAVELGVTEIIPLYTTRTERSRFKPERARNLLIAAMKQCGRSRLPHLADPQPIQSILKETPASPARFIAHETTVLKEGLHHHLDDLPADAPVVILIGPEGGFTPEEVTTAQASGWTPVSLGPRCLRAETAALVAAMAVQLRRPD